MQNLGFCKFTVYICQKIVFLNFYIQLFLPSFFCNKKSIRSLMLSLEFSFLNSWKEFMINKNNIEARTFIHSTYWPREYIVNIIWKLEYWRVNYHPPKGRWLLGSHRLLFKKFGIWVSTWILRQPLFLQACPHRLYCIGS